ncbi:hypothetical protein [Paenibacillus barengoltzii]|uniref:Uncharacterized protein n=1 Tax=Paenibacillus barengoltzii G22 TaxID=1235795 RepID=R9LG09_9BACL|nr:hypothetical protein [Paenibacillus barengoltzii]EOS57670.1 hypothetical protein C812_00715 [Paenibacillus barengoltzii G22]
MFYLIPRETEENIVAIQIIINDPYPEQEVEGGFYVTELPTANTPEGMYPVLMYKKDTQELFYNYEINTLPPEPILSFYDQLAELSVKLEEADASNLLALDALASTFELTLELQDKASTLQTEIETLKNGTVA